ncbi:MAG TPA: benzoate/H(+) symporter BenE family transporter [Candidatus Limnocylindrales bacterium]|jgi:benzoate membrane transport protein
MAAALPAVMVFLAVLTIPLSAAPSLGLSTGQLSSWVFALYAGPGILGLWLAIRHHQPLVLTGNVFAIILFASEARHVSFPALAGASVVAGAAVAALGVAGLTRRLTRLVPPPIVVGLLAGAVLPFVVRLFTNVGQDPLVVGGALAGYLLGRRFLSSVTPLLPALVVGVTLAAATGKLGLPPTFSLPQLAVTLPTFSVEALVTVTPIVIAIMVLQANLPSLVFLRSQGYDPPEREIDLVSGVGTVALSFLGPNAVSVPLPIMPLVAGPECGASDRRVRAATAAGIALIVIGLFAGVAVGLVTFLPGPLVQGLAGLALLGVLATSLKQVVAGPLVLGPLVAFVVVQSSLTLLGLGPFFWALVLGVAVSRLLEPGELRALGGAPPVENRAFVSRELEASELADATAGPSINETERPSGPQA